MDEQHRSEVNELKREKDSLRSEMVTLRTENDSLRSKIMELQPQVDKLIDRFRDNRSERHKAEGDLRTARASVGLRLFSEWDLLYKVFWMKS
jgi:chromosome segregation ATPase